MERSCGFAQILKDFAMGRMLADPFPAEATEELRFYLGAVTKQARVTLPEGTKLQPHPVVAPLLGSALKGLGDPGWRIRAQYAVGMPLGLGVELLRGGSLSYKPAVGFSKEMLPVGCLAIGGNRLGLYCTRHQLAFPHALGTQSLAGQRPSTAWA